MKNQKTNFSSIKFLALSVRLTKVAAKELPRNGLRVLAAAALLFLLLAAPAKADWPNTNATKFVQLPDITTNGMDIEITNYPAILADDFVCTNTGPISDIHLWLSSLINQPTSGAAFELSIWSDVPSIPGSGQPSHPGRKLWSEVFGPGQYRVVTAAVNLQEQFWNLDPTPPAFLGPDNTLFQYNFYPTNPFTQTGTFTAPVVYWLGVSLVNNDPPLMGWKTSTNKFAPDDAVLGHYNSAGTVSDWKELFDPRNPNLSLSFSFALTTLQPTNPPPTCCPDTDGVKFLQRPDVGHGLDVQDSQNITLADDFLCNQTGPITDLHIWGSWLNDQVDPTTVFTLSIWSDVPAITGPAGVIPSHPGRMLWTESFGPNGPNQYVLCPFTNAPEQFYDPSVPAILGVDQQLYYLCFFPTNPFVQQGTAAKPTVYWLAVNAQTSPTTVLPFGWKTSLDSFNDTAVWAKGPLPPPAWNELIDPQGLPLSLAFKLTTPTNQCPPPVLTCATNKTVPCGVNWTFDPPTVSDSCCPTNVTIKVLSTVTNGVCPQNITQTWVATDCNGSTATCSQTVSVVGGAPPVITCGTNKTVPCGSAWSFDTPTAYDPCLSGSIVPVGVVSTVTNNQGPCTQFITQTWAATNSCSGAISTCSQTVTVVDTAPPIITCGTNKTVVCGSSWSFDTPKAYDACSGAPVPVTVISTNTDSSGPCTQFITQTWAATNLCSGAVATCSQTVKIVDIAPPIITCGTNKTVVCGTSWSFDTPTAVDACSGASVPVGVVSTVATNKDSCTQIITQTWAATNSCSGAVATCSQTVTVVDTAPPVITCGTNKTVMCGSNWSFDKPTAFDLCSQTMLPVGVVSTVTNSQDPCVQVITQTWAATNVCSGAIATCSQTVTVVDLTPPVIICGTNKTVECGSNWSFDKPTAFDACTGAKLPVGVVSTVTSTQSPCIQVVTRTWAATNLCSGIVATCSQAVTVVDTTPPVIICPSNMVVQTCSTNIAVNWSVTATDACSSVVSIVSTPPSGTVFATGTTNHVHCVATDACGNTNSCDFLVIVTRPILSITFNGGAGTITLTWSDGVLQQATNVIGPYTDVPLAVSPYTVSTVGPQKFFRVRCP